VFHEACFQCCACFLCKNKCNDGESLTTHPLEKQRVSYNHQAVVLSEAYVVHYLFLPRFYISLLLLKGIPILLGLMQSS
jgi:hypothetical protein